MGVKAESPPTARQILRRMASVYRTCETYQDTGTVFAEGRTIACREQLRFQTAFRRPNQFRFEYVRRSGTKYEERYVIWTERLKPYAWWTIKPSIEPQESIDRTIAAAAGVSSGSAHTIPRLLMPRLVRGWSLAYLSEPRLLGTDRVDGAECFVVEGGNTLGDAETVWIDTAQHLVRKVVWHRPEVEKTTIYEPMVNTAIAEAAFESGL